MENIRPVHVKAELGPYLLHLIEAMRPEPPQVQVIVAGLPALAGKLSYSHGVFHLDTWMTVTGEQPSARKAQERAPMRISFTASSCLCVMKELDPPPAPVLHVS